MDGATTRRIAEEANAPLATLHYCFSSKEVLFAAVFEYVTWMATNLGDVSLPARRASTVSHAETLRSLASWVSVE